MSEMHGAVTIVTGAGRGIGRGLAERFAALGATLVATVRSHAAQAELGAVLAPHPNATVEQLDVTSETAVHDFAAAVRERWQHVDVLINNAGVFLPVDRAMTADALDPRAVRTTFETNVIGAVVMCTHLVPCLRDEAHVVNVSSTMGQLDGGLGPTSVAYSVSKTALNAYTSALAAALDGRRILVDAVHPGWVKTAMGGAGAPRAIGAAVEDLVWHARRTAADGPSGRFWSERRIIEW